MHTWNPSGSPVPAGLIVLEPWARRRAPSLLVGFFLSFLFHRSRLPERISARRTAWNFKDTRRVPRKSLRRPGLESIRAEFFFTLKYSTVIELLIKKIYSTISSSIFYTIYYFKIIPIVRRAADGSRSIREQSANDIRNNLSQKWSSDPRDRELLSFRYYLFSVIFNARIPRSVSAYYPSLTETIEAQTTRFSESPFPTLYRIV